MLQDGILVAVVTMQKLEAELRRGFHLSAIINENKADTTGEKKSNPAVIEKS